jgi:hypothetical protein
MKMQPWISLLTTITGDLLVLAAAVINLAAARAQRHPGTRRRRTSHRERPAARTPGKPATG